MREKALVQDHRALGERLFVHGPEAITLPDALDGFFAACHPPLKVIRMKLPQAWLFAEPTRRQGLPYVSRLIAYLDEVGELGDPTEADDVFGTSTIALEEWCRTRRNEEGGGRIG